MSSTVFHTINCNNVTFLVSTKRKGLAGRDYTGEQEQGILCIQRSMNGPYTQCVCVWLSVRLQFDNK